MARLLKTDLNTLLSFKNDLTDLEINKIVSDIALNYSKETFEDTYNKSLKLLCEYPTCDKLRLNLALALSGSLTIFNIEEKEVYESKITQMFEQCTLSDDRLIKNQAVSFLINNFISTKQFDKAQELIDTLDHFPFYDKVLLQSNLHVVKSEYSQAVKALEGKLASGVNDIFTTLLYLMDIAIKEKHEDNAFYYAQLIEKTCKLFEMWEYSAHSAYFQYYSSFKKENEFIITLKNMLQALEHPWDTAKTNLYSHLESKDKHPVSKQFLEVIVNQLKANSDGELDFVKDNPEFIKLINKY